MVVAKAAAQVGSIELPIIDLLGERSEVGKQIVKACEELGFFKVINHGVDDYVVRRMEEECSDFFAKPASLKQRAGPPNPCGYGCKSIGFNGDFGEVEYLLLHANPLSISNHPIQFRCVWGGDSCAVNEYVEAVKELACEILEVMAEGLGVPNTSVFSRLIKDEDDSLLRLNHYPSLNLNHNTDSDSDSSNIGFGEHTDPQILTILKSNHVPGLQISVDEGVWLPVTPQPHSAFFINVGDALQALTNGRFLSVRHRALVHSCKTRMSMAYFAAPAPHARIACPRELVTPHKPYLYRPFTWAEYKKATYSRRLGDGRLQFFRAHTDDDETCRE